MNLLLGIGFSPELVEQINMQLLSDLYCAAILCLLSVRVIHRLPPGLPECCYHQDHSFTTGLDRIRWCAPALVLQMVSDPESFFR